MKFCVVVFPKAELSAMLLDRRMERNNGVAAVVLATGPADIAYDANHSAARYERPKALRRHLVELLQELVGRQNSVVLRQNSSRRGKSLR